MEGKSEREAGLRLSSPTGHAKGFRFNPVGQVMGSRC